MLRAKKIDSIGQLLLIPSFIIYSFMQRDDSFIIGYYVVGSWQIVSMLFHLFGAQMMPTHIGRKRYEKLMLGIFLALVGSFIIGYPLFVGAMLLFAAPFLAAWYAWFSNKELQVWEARNLIHLKN